MSTHDHSRRGLASSLVVCASYGPDPPLRAAVLQSTRMQDPPGIESNRPRRPSRVSCDRIRVMGKTYQAIGDEHREFIERQHVFFVASAPLAADGHVNLSPKGLEALHVIDPNTVMYLDLTGSGNETAAHVTENGRLTLMFCAFDGHPKILRLYCRGQIVTRGTPGWADALAHFPHFPGIRQIVIGRVESVQTSCGFGVPLLSFTGQRDQLPRWAENRGEAAMVEYRRTRNTISLDGLPTPAMDPSESR